MPSESPCTFGQSDFGSVYGVVVGTSVFLVVVDRPNLLRSKIATLASRLSAVQCAGLRVKDLEVEPNDKADGEMSTS